MELLIVLLVVAGIGFFALKGRRIRKNAETVAQQPPQYVPPPRPVMSPPQDGGMSVGIAQADDAVWVWILITETTKHALSQVMQEPIDHYPLDLELANQRVREYTRETDRIGPLSTDTKEQWEYKRTNDLAFAKKTFLTPRPILLRELLANPFRYPVSSAHAAAEYVERCETKILPKIKTMIEAQSRPKTETFEL